MKLTQKHLRIASGIATLSGAIVAGLLEGTGKYIGIGIILIGLILFMPWIKEEEKK